LNHDALNHEFKKKNKIKLLTPWSGVLVKLTGYRLVKKFPAFYGTRMFVTNFYK